MWDGISSRRPSLSFLAADRRLLFVFCMPPENEKTLQEPKSRARSGVGIGIGVLLTILIAAGIWFRLSRGEDSSANSPAMVKSTLHLETFVLNLSDPEQRAYLRVGIDLGLDHEPKHGEEAPLAEVRDTILGVLAEARADELLTSAGKSKLKESLLRALQDRMPQLGAEEVYFTEFLIQR
jgi:flagellar basal body-associated protein FliL